MIFSNIFKKPSNKEGKATGGTTRRDFLGWLALGSFWSVIGTSLMGMVRFLRPAVPPGASPRLKLGTLDDFPLGTARKFEDKNVFVLRDQEGIFAISGVCTHLGCIVQREEGGKFI